MPELTDYEVARTLRKHPRTIQRWCSSGKLPGSYKAGRSWRIPERALRRAQLATGRDPDEVEHELKAAALACQQLSAELKDMQRGIDVPTRNWRGLSHRLGELGKSLDGLLKRARAVPDKNQRGPS